jgi:hypothetical protein
MEYSTIKFKIGQRHPRETVSPSESRVAETVANERLYRLITCPIAILPLEPIRWMADNKPLIGSCRHGGGQGEPGGTRAMGVCEPGQGGNAAAISNTLMCLGEPPRLSPVPAWESCRGERG